MKTATWMVHWILRGGGDAVPFRLLRTVPACAFDASEEYDTGCTQFEAVHPLRPDWMLGISRNLEMGTSVYPNPYEIWCYEKDATADDRAFILVSSGLTLTHARKIVRHIAKIDPEENIEALEQFDKAYKKWHTRVNTRIPETSNGEGGRHQ